MATLPIDLLGGVRVLGKNASDPSVFREKLRAGLPYRSLEAVTGPLELTQTEIGHILSIPLRTLARRKQQGHLTRDESDRLHRAARIVAHALDVFENPSGAAGWMRTFNAALQAVPLDLIADDAGAKAVDDVLGRIEWGIFS